MLVLQFIICKTLDAKQLYLKFTLNYKKKKTVASQNKTQYVSSLNMDIFNNNHVVRNNVL